MLDLSQPMTDSQAVKEPQIRVIMSDYAANSISEISRSETAGTAAYAG